jgi:hypothetical protein
MLALLASTSTAFGQGQVYLFGQMASTTRIAKIPDVAKLKSSIPVISFKTTGSNGKTVLNNTTSRLQISSVTNEQSSRRLSAAITSGESQKGTTLILSLISPDNFKGYIGDSDREVILNKTDAILVSGIGTCYSGNGNNDGFNMEYTFIIPSTIKTKTNNTITVTLTMSEEV